MSRCRRPGRAATAAALLGLLLAGCSADGSAPASEGPAGDGTAAPSGAGVSEPATVEGLPTWEQRGVLSVPRDDFATAVVGDDIWVLGGMTGDRGTRLDSVEVLDTATGRWRLADTRVPEGLASFEGVAVGHEIYLFGGLSTRSRATDFAAVLDTRSGRWRRLPALPTPRYAHTVTLHDGRIYVIGGDGSQGPVEQVDVFDPATEAWSTAAPMPQARGSHDAVSLGEVVYVLGGWLDAGPSDLVHTYDPAADRWEPAPPLPEPVSRAGAAALDGRLWVSYHELSFVLDARDQTWSPANPLSVSRHGLGYVPVGDTIYGIGGCTPSPLRDVRTVDVLELG